LRALEFFPQLFEIYIFSFRAFQENPAPLDGRVGTQLRKSKKVYPQIGQTIKNVR